MEKERGGLGAPYVPPSEEKGVGQVDDAYPWRKERWWWARPGRWIGRTRCRRGSPVPLSMRRGPPPVY